LVDRNGVCRDAGPELLGHHLEVEPVLSYAPSK
jgi:hypothetical protein